MGRKEMLKIKRFVIDRFVHGRHAIETFSPRFLLILVSGIVFFFFFFFRILSTISIYVFRDVDGK